MDQILKVVEKVDWAAVAQWAVAGAMIGAAVMPLFVYIAMRLNQDRIRDLYKARRIPEDGRFYSVFAIFGAQLFSLFIGSQPVLDAAGEDEVYVRGAILVFIMAVLAPPFVRALRRLRDDG